MSPALQRLVARPSSRELLRLLVGNDGAVGCYAPANMDAKRGSGGGQTLCLRKYTGVATAARERVDRDQELLEAIEDGTGKASKSRQRARLSSHRAPKNFEKIGQRKNMDFVSAAPTLHAGIASGGQGVLAADTASSPPVPATSTRTLAHPRQNQWEETMFSHDRLDFESNVALMPTGDQARLLDSTHATDMALWAVLLGYRKRIHGMEGVREFWNAVQQRHVQLPTKGHSADQIWHAFLALGFEDPAVLEAIYEYAKRSKDQHGLSWGKFYPQVVGHFLAAHEGEMALKWHNRLSKLHQPGPTYFGDMCRRVAAKEGDLATLRQIYNMQPHRSVYSKIMPIFCQKEQYKLALQWHSFLCKNGDTPNSAKVAEPLVQYLSTYNRSAARTVTQDLVAAGVSFAGSLSQKLEDNTNISREIMNIIHGETFHIPVKKYNDKLGARWFATTWVSLDVAINAVHALGVQKIGPLSLQAIALRDPDPEAIVSRIEQLEGLGIAIGKSLFCRAVERFARDGQPDLLDGLLKSDQHPDELQNFELQEALLSSYAKDADWTQYRRTLKIRLLASMSPEVERRNIELRVIASTNDISVALRSLEDMLNDGIMVHRATASLLLEHTLGPRRGGKRPMTLQTPDHRYGKNGLIRSTQMLKSIMRSGTYVHPKHWQEIIRRTGMLGQMSSLRNLCSWLANCYGPQNHTSTESWLQRYRVPLELPTSHGLHPLSVLFPPRLQAAIVEWGFIAAHPEPSHSPPSSHLPVTSGIVQTCSSAMTSGIYILKKLNSLGVHIDRRTVRKAIFNRLITYYGPGYSNRRGNEVRRQTIGTLEDAAKQIDEALGGEYFTAVELQEIVQQMALGRWQRLERRKMKSLGLQSRDPRSRLLLGPGVPSLPPLVKGAERRDV